MAEHFQQTMRTWIGQRLAHGEAGLADVRQHVAETYRLPLEIYYAATSWCRERGSSAAGGEDPDWSPSEVVHDYLADRLGRPDYLQQWAESGLSLRRWLINGLLFYLKERHRQLAGPARGRGAAGLSGLEISDDPGRRADRLMVGGLVRRAVKQTLAKLEEAGQAAHGRAFVAFHFEQASIEAIARELAKSPGQVKGMLRLARTRFRAVFVELLTHDGVPAERHDAELRAMLEVIQG